MRARPDLGSTRLVPALVAGALLLATAVAQQRQRELYTFRGSSAGDRSGTSAR